VSPPPAHDPLERRAIISGIGQSDVGRRLGRSDLDLTIEAAMAAIADAGLSRDDIDGISTYPGMGAGTAGFGGPTTPESVGRRESAVHKGEARRRTTTTCWACRPMPVTKR